MECLYYQKREEKKYPVPRSFWKFKKQGMRKLPCGIDTDMVKLTRTRKCHNFKHGSAEWTFKM